MSAVLVLHQRLAIALILLGVVGCGWTFVGLRRQGGTPPGVRAMLVLTEGLALLQGLFGITLYSSGLRPANVLLHTMYGVASVLVLPVAYVLSGRASRRGEAYYVGLGSLLLAGVAFRALAVGAR
ncbi:MAG TPA: hypothetical protein VNN74_11255 [Candidatus Micrarchaeia archaeon]|nr:hypothetical protein [Candidatus Micrarchaeia archaeon]